MPAEAAAGLRRLQAGAGMFAIEFRPIWSPAGSAVGCIFCSQLTANTINLEGNVDPCGAGQDDVLPRAPHAQRRQHSTDAQGFVEGTSACRGCWHVRLVTMAVSNDACPHYVQQNDIRHANSRHVS